MSKYFCPILSLETFTLFTVKYEYTILEVKHMKRRIIKILFTLALICVVETNIPYSGVDSITPYSDAYVDTDSSK